MEEMESMQWQKIATEDLKQGGSLRVERKSPVFLTGKVTHHNSFFFNFTYKQLWNISILTLSIYYVSALCSAKVIKRTSSDLPNNTWGKYRVTEVQKAQVTFPRSHSSGRVKIWIQTDWLQSPPLALKREPENSSLTRLMPTKTSPQLYWNYSLSCIWKTCAIPPQNQV